MQNYDPKVINEFANRLYKRARSIIATYTLAGLLAGAVGGLMTKEPIVAIIAGLLGGALGYTMGRDKAFSLKLEAQTALCQVQIETNSRASLAE